MNVWNVKRDEERVQWQLVPLVSVGPLSFGMTRAEVLAALEPEFPHLSGSREGLTHSGTPAWGECVTTYYSKDRLYCVAIDALRGPQVTVDGVPLVGRVPSELEAWMLATQVPGLRYSHAADPELEEIGLVVRPQRAGDVVLTRPVFLRRLAVSWDTVPSEEWFRF
ncbi:hypothetical protein [Catellatospora sp. NPDC049609]|uniref:hypothetical protein n=1 Tax=Catellatospora sp. NPDC049609 TaxID=3155505 RepID=UPI003413824C